MRQVNPGQRQRACPCALRIAVIAAAIAAAVIAATAGLVLLPLIVFI